LIDLIIGFLVLIIKAFDNQTETFEMLDDNHDYFVLQNVRWESAKVNTQVV